MRVAQKARNFDHILLHLFQPIWTGLLESFKSRMSKNCLADESLIYFCFYLKIGSSCSSLLVLQLWSFVKTFFKSWIEKHNAKSFDQEKQSFVKLSEVQKSAGQFSDGPTFQSFSQGKNIFQDLLKKIKMLMLNEPIGPGFLLLIAPLFQQQPTSVGVSISLGFSPWPTSSSK